MADCGVKSIVIQGDGKDWITAMWYGEQWDLQDSP